METTIKSAAIDDVGMLTEVSQHGAVFAVVDPVSASALSFSMVNERIAHAVSFEVMPSGQQVALIEIKGGTNLEALQRAIGKSRDLATSGHAILRACEGTAATKH